MTRPYDSSSIEGICEAVKELGFGLRQRVRLYGEEFEVISDPFPEAEGIVVRVRTHADEIRVIQLPSTILQSVISRGSHAA